MMTSPLTVRLGEQDQVALRHHFLALDRDDRRLRFGTPLGDEAIASYVARIDFSHDAVFGVRGDDHRLKGVVHVAFTPSAAELGLSVRSRNRGQGIGGALFARAVAHLRNRGVREVFVHCLSENQAMMHLSRRNGMRVVSEAGESEAFLALDPADGDTLFREWMHEHQSAVLMAMRRQSRLVRAALLPAALR